MSTHMNTWQYHACAPSNIRGMMTGAGVDTHADSMGHVSNGPTLLWRHFMQHTPTLPPTNAPIPATWRTAWAGSMQSVHARMHQTRHMTSISWFYTLRPQCAHPPTCASLHVTHVNLHCTPVSVVATCHQLATRYDVTVARRCPSP